MPSKLPSRDNHPIHRNPPLGLKISVTMTRVQKESDDTLSGSPKDVERIYIGGLDPDRLSIREVLDRFPSHVKIESVSHPDVNPSYCHLSAYVLPNDNAGDDHNVSALKEIQNLLHNVKWKGCKLQVQAAKPHFLQRLQTERETRTKHDHNQDGENHAQQDGVVESTATTATTTTHRRYYRVRYGYGKPAWVVDTKPYQVSDGKVFGKLVQHVRKRKLINDDTNTPKKPFRAVHWKFDDESDANVPNASTRHGPAAADVSADSMTDSSLDTSSSGSKNQQNRGGYVWSDDDQSTSSSTDSSESSRQVGAKPDPVTHDFDDDFDDDDDGMEKDGNTPSEKLMSMKQPADNRPGTYAWSDDDDDGSRGATADAATDDRTPRRVAAQDNSPDEFAASLDDNEIPNQSVATYSEGNDDSDAVAVNVEDDEERNLKILATLYPEMARTNGTPSTSETPKKKEGWNASGQMMRYDPTKASSKQLERKIEESSSDEASENKSIADRAKDEQDNEQQTIPQRSDQSGIYRQDDLENVFREARESQASRAPVVVEKEAAIEAPVAPTGNAFSFGFDVPNEQPTVKDNSSSFSFGFDLSGVTKTKAEHAVEEETVPQAIEPSTPQKHRKKLQSPYNDLAAYVEAYLLELNEGERVAHNLNDFRRDPTVHEDWARQRQRLTTDWKAKRKNAIARRQSKRHR